MFNYTFVITPECLYHLHWYYATFSFRRNLYTKRTTQFDCLGYTAPPLPSKDEEGKQSNVREATHILKVMAGAARKNRQGKGVVWRDKKRKCESNKIRGRARVNIGAAFTSWHELKKEKGCPTDEDLDQLLLD